MGEGTEVVASPGRGITQRARGEFDSGQMQLIAATVAKDCNPAELAMFLELCARYELDPFTKQVWAIRLNGAVQTVVSRDGLLSLANRHTPANGFSGPGEFLGCESDVVCEGDEFRKVRGVVSRDEHGHPIFGTQVEHSYDVQGRGAIIGAWAIVHRREHTPTYFFAPWATYNTGKNVWKTHPEAMIVKSAEAMALRKAFSISGVVGEAEVPDRQVITETPETGSAEPEWPADPELAEKLRFAFEVLGFRKAKVRLLLAGKDQEGYEALLHDLNGQVDRMAEEADAEAQEASQRPQGDESVVDAEVVQP